MTADLQIHLSGAGLALTQNSGAVSDAAKLVDSLRALRCGGVIKGACQGKVHAEGISPDAWVSSALPAILPSMMDGPACFPSPRRLRSPKSPLQACWPQGLMLGEVAHLEPCYLCNFQRLLYIVIALLALCAGLINRWPRVWGVLIAAAALWVSPRRLNRAGCSSSRIK